MQCTAVRQRILSTPGAELRATDVGEARMRLWPRADVQSSAEVGRARSRASSFQGRRVGLLGRGVVRRAGGRLATSSVRWRASARDADVWFGSGALDVRAALARIGNRNSRRGAVASTTRQPNISMEPTRERPLAAAHITRLGRAAHFGRSAS